MGGGEGGANTCRTSSCFTRAARLTVSAGDEILTRSGKRYTPLLTRDAPSSWQLDRLHAIPALGECSHSIPFFVASLFAGEFIFPCPCAAHMFPAQHAVPCAIHADAHIGVHSSNTAIRHTQAPTILCVALATWSERVITRDSRIPEPLATFHILPHPRAPCPALPARRISP